MGDPGPAVQPQRWQIAIATADNRNQCHHLERMSFLSPGSYLRSKLTATEYDVRCEKTGARIMVLKSHECASLISTSHVFGKLGQDGELKYLISHVPASKLRAQLQKAVGEGPRNAEDSKTTLLDGQTYRFHTRRVLAWAR
jgi:hypothetical protein